MASNGEKRSAAVKKLAEELKQIQDSLIEDTFQANKVLKSINQSETNRVYSEDIIRLSHQISKSHSVASPLSWQQGDPGRPFPTEADFAVSALMHSRRGVGHLQQQTPQQQQQMHPSFPSQGQRPLSASQQFMPGGSFSRTNSTGALRASPGMSTAFVPAPQGMGQQKPFTPSPRSGIFGPNPTGASPRGRPPGSTSGARMPSPAARAAMPSILQRRPSQSPRMGPGEFAMGLEGSGGSGGVTVNLPHNLAMNQQQQSVPEVGKISSDDSSSSSSSGDEGR